MPMIRNDGTPFEFTKKQIEYWNNCNRLYNIMSGATGSGKTWLGLHFLPERIKMCNNGAIVILANTRGTAERNIIIPLQEKYGSEVSDISSKNICRMFGKDVFVLGASKKNMVDAIRGTNLGYVYGDEVATWSQEVFEMLKTRLRLDNSIFDGTCNPEDPNHWLKKFIDESVEAGDMFYQHYHIDDGALSENIKDRMKRSLSGVFYDRYIRGLWIRADGLIYERFGANPEKYYIEVDKIPPLMQVTVGVDFGGGPSKHAFVATGISDNYENLYILASERIEPRDYDSKGMAQQLIKFIRRVEHLFRVRVDYIYADSADPVRISDIDTEVYLEGMDILVRPSEKGTIMGRITMTDRLIGEERLFYTEHAESVKSALEEASWDKKEEGNTKRLDDHSTDIDTLDAFEYSFSSEIYRLSSYEMYI